jgi:superfamily II DNA helicase RecQ
VLCGCPETLLSDSWLKVFAGKHWKASVIANVVDELHYIEEADWRTSYTNLGVLRSYFTESAAVGLTATAYLVRLLDPLMLFTDSSNCQSPNSTRWVYSLVL